MTWTFYHFNEKQGQKTKKKRLDAECDVTCYVLPYHWMVCSDQVHHMSSRGVIRSDTTENFIWGPIQKKTEAEFFFIVILNIGP